MSYVESELRVKKVWEVVSAVIALGIVVYGYIITRSLILGIITLFILATFSVAFLVSYLLPRIYHKSSKSGGVT